MHYNASPMFWQGEIVYNKLVQSLVVFYLTQDFVLTTIPTPQRRRIAPGLLKNERGGPRRIAPRLMFGGHPANEIISFEDNTALLNADSALSGFPAQIKTSLCRFDCPAFTEYFDFKSKYSPEGVPILAYLSAPCRAKSSRVPRFRVSPDIKIAPHQTVQGLDNSISGGIYCGQIRALSKDG